LSSFPEQKQPSLTHFAAEGNLYSTDPNTTDNYQMQPMVFEERFSTRLFVREVVKPSDG